MVRPVSNSATPVTEIQPTTMSEDDLARELAHQFLVDTRYNYVGTRDEPKIYAFMKRVHDLGPVFRAKFEQAVDAEIAQERFFSLPTFCEPTRDYYTMVGNGSILEGILNYELEGVVEKRMALANLKNGVFVRTPDLYDLDFVMYGVGLNDFGTPEAVAGLLALAVALRIPRVNAWLFKALLWGGRAEIVYGAVKFTTSVSSSFTTEGVQHDEALTNVGVAAAHVVNGRLMSLGGDLGLKQLAALKMEQAAAAARAARAAGAIVLEAIEGPNGWFVPQAPVPVVEPVVTPPEPVNVAAAASVQTAASASAESAFRALFFESGVTLSEAVFSPTLNNPNQISVAVAPEVFEAMRSGPWSVTPRLDVATGVPVLIFDLPEGRVVVAVSDDLAPETWQPTTANLLHAAAAVADFVGGGGLIGAATDVGSQMMGRDIFSLGARSDWYSPWETSLRSNIQLPNSVWQAFHRLFRPYQRSPDQFVKKPAAQQLTIIASLIPVVGEAAVLAEFARHTTEKTRECIGMLNTIVVHLQALAAQKAAAAPALETPTLNPAEQAIQDINRALDFRKPGDATFAGYELQPCELALIQEGFGTMLAADFGLACERLLAAARLAPTNEPQFELDLSAAFAAMERVIYPDPVARAEARFRRLRETSDEGETTLVAFAEQLGELSKTQGITPARLTAAMNDILSQTTADLMVERLEYWLSEFESQASPAKAPAKPTLPASPDSETTDSETLPTPRASPSLSAEVAVRPGITARIQSTQLVIEWKSQGGAITQKVVLNTLQGKATTGRFTQINPRRMFDVFVDQNGIIRDLQGNDLQDVVGGLVVPKISELRVAFQVAHVRAGF